MDSPDSYEQLITEYIEEKKEIYDSFMAFLENITNDDDQKLQFFKETLNKYETQWNIDEIRQFLYMISNISENHHRCHDFINKINEILIYFQEQIKKNFSDIEIFHIFRNNLIILHFLFRNQILTFSENVYQEMINQTERKVKKYLYFFYPEIKSFMNEDQINDINNDLFSKDSNILDKFNENRSVGENEKYICTLIRQDSIDEFVSYIRQYEYSLESEIEDSIFETNSFLIENNPTLIEYSAFFGSTQIFQYLHSNKVKITPSLWYYAIHSNNLELIHLLEAYNIELPIDGYNGCFNESIKCHHNNIADYFNNKITKQKIENRIQNIFHYHNYKYFPSYFDDYEFYYLSFYGYHKFVNLFMKKQENNIKSIII